MLSQRVLNILAEAGGNDIEIHLGVSDAAYETIVSMPGASRSISEHLGRALGEPDGVYLIATAYLTIDGVSIRAQRTHRRVRVEEVADA